MEKVTIKETAPTGRTYTTPDGKVLHITKLTLADGREGLTFSQKFKPGDEATVDISQGKEGLQIKYVNTQRNVSNDLVKWSMLCTSNILSGKTFCKREFEKTFEEVYSIMVVRTK